MARIDLEPLPHREAIDRLFAGRTRILISHRPSTLADADLRFELLDGVLTSKTVLHEV